MLENLRAKLNNLSAQKEQLIAQLNAISGAEQILNEIIEELEAAEGDEQNG